jgi:hypothetical protein
MELLSRIEVHLPFDVTARWSKIGQGDSILRGSTTIRPTKSLARFGAKLANAYHVLKNDFSDEDWQETMDYVRLGLGSDLDSVNLRSDASGSAIALWLKSETNQVIPEKKEFILLAASFVPSDEAARF